VNEWTAEDRPMLTLKGWFSACFEHDPAPIAPPHAPTWPQIRERIETKLGHSIEEELSERA
jgi:hypothetical protein